MNEIQAFVLGLVQGLTEFLPVSSSGHLEIGNHIFHQKGEENLTFTIALHTATVLSTLVVFRKEIRMLMANGLTFKKNAESGYILKLFLSSVPVAIVGLFFREEVESLFTGNLLLVGSCLVLTATLLSFAHFSNRERTRDIGWKHSLIIGTAQALAVLPGISRSGSTIATGILLGNKKEETARFSFLMVIIPILGAAFLDLSHKSSDVMQVNPLPLAIGFLTAFFTGWLACSWMINIVKKGKLIYFAVYCLAIGLIAIFAA